MKIIIAGSGEVGSHLAKLLSYESQEITLIDSNKENLSFPNSHLDIINFTLEQPIPENEFSFLGNHDALRVDDYYQVHYDSICNFHGDNNTYEIPHAYVLLGPNNAISM